MLKCIVFDDYIFRLSKTFYIGDLQLNPLKKLKTNYESTEIEEVK